MSLYDRRFAITVHRTIVWAVGGTAALFLLTAPLAAQQLTKNSGWGARMILEPVILAHGGFGSLCNSRAAARSQWGAEQIEKVVQPTESQRVAFDELKAAAAKATDLSAGACPREIPKFSSERLSFMKRRLEATLAAVKTVEPPFAAFYAALGDEQKARIDAGPRRWRWPR
jgi:hypothetical protein